jgi:hypothetical protein
MDEPGWMKRWRGFGGGLEEQETGSRFAAHASMPYEFVRFGAMDVTKPYEFIGFGAMDVTKPYQCIGLGDIHGRKPY